MNNADQLFHRAIAGLKLAHCPHCKRNAVPPDVPNEACQWCRNRRQIIDLYDQWATGQRSNTP